MFKALAGLLLAGSMFAADVVPAVKISNETQFLTTAETALPSLRFTAPFTGTYLVAVNLEVVQAYPDLAVIAKLYVGDRAVPGRLIMGIGGNEVRSATISGVFFVRIQAGETLEIRARRVANWFYGERYRAGVTTINPEGSTLSVVPIQMQ